jgi:glycerol kinase
MGKSVPIAGIAGDQQAALFGQCCFLPGEIKNTYGTGCFLLMNTGHRAVKSNHGLLTTLIATSKDKPDYALEGSVFIAGAAIQWLRDELGLISSAAESEDCCKKVEDTAGVYVVPAFTGLGAPYWNQRARGIITGLTRGANKNHIVRATVESLAYEVYDLIEVMKRDAELDLVELKVDGGASSNDFLMQFQADILGATVVRPDCIETTALGAAYLAGLATNYWTSEDEIRENWKLSSTFTSEIGENDRLNLLKGWFDAVAKIK